MLTYLRNTLSVNFVSVSPLTSYIPVYEYKSGIRYRHQLHALNIIDRLIFSKNRDALIAITKQHIRYNNLRRLWMSIPEDIVFESIPTDITLSQAQRLVELVSCRNEWTIITALTVCKIGYYLDNKDKESIVRTVDFITDEMLCLEPKDTLIEYVQCMPTDLFGILYEDIFSICDLVTHEFNYPLAKALVDKSGETLSPIYNPLKFDYTTADEFSVLLYHIEYLGLHVEDISKYLKPDMVDDIIHSNIKQTYLHKLAAVILSSKMKLDYHLKERVMDMLIIDDCHFCRQLRYNSI